MEVRLQPVPQIPEAQQLASLQAQMLRPVQRLVQDGGFELGWGTALVCFGFSSYFNALVTRSHWFSPWTAWIGFLPLLCAAFAPYTVAKLIRRFITWPRVGYFATPNDLSFRKLLLLLVFGGVLGSAISLPIVLVLQIRHTIGQPHLQHDVHTIIFTGIKFLVCAWLVVYLGPKVVRKPKPVPTAYDADLITKGLSQSKTGRRRLRLVRLTLLALFLGAPILACGLVFGLMLWNKSAGHSAAFHWSALGLPSFLVGVNALLYFMGSGLVLKPNRWKWLVLPAMLVVPVLAAPLIPYPALPEGLSAIMDPLPPVMLCLGAVWLLSGAITLLLFIRHTPAARPDLA